MQTTVNYNGNKARAMRDFREYTKKVYSELEKVCIAHYGNAINEEEWEDIDKSLTILLDVVAGVSGYPVACFLEHCKTLSMKG